VRLADDRLGQLLQSDAIFVTSDLAPKAAVRRARQNFALVPIADLRAKQGRAADPTLAGLLSCAMTYRTGTAKLRAFGEALVAEQRVNRRLTTILAADVAGYSRLTGADEEGTVSRLRAHRQELIDPIIAGHGGRTIKLMGDGRLVEFASVVDAVRCALEVQRGMTARNANIAPDKRIEFRVGIHVGDVMVESDGDLMGDGVNIAARLEGIAEPGGICLSEDAWRQVRDKIVAEFADLGEQSLKNIARPVRAYRVDTAGTGENARGSSAPPTPASPSAPRLSIVVLPFANIGGDPEQDYFVDGVTESLTTDLSRIAGSFVIARNTAFTYKGKPFDVKQIARDLNVRYVLEGSVQRGGGRMRVNVQLIDAESGSHLWAERFDKPLADLFDMQDEIVARLANQLGTEMIEAEARRAETSPAPDAMDLYFQGQVLWNKSLNPDGLKRAHALFDRAVALDPRNVEVLVARAYVDAVLGGGSLSDDRQARLAAAEATLIEAMSLAPNHAGAHMSMGYLQVHTNRAAQGIAELERALLLDRNLASAHALIGQGKYYLGRGEETHAHIREAFRLSPRDILAFLWLFLDGVAALQLGHDAEAAALLRGSIEANRNNSLSNFFLAAALAHLDRLDEARAAVQAGLSVDAGFTIRRFRASGAASTNQKFREQRERVIDGMRLAGVPEG
jgi:TolB-like protein/class 3 adenylate cyclase